MVQIALIRPGLTDYDEQGRISGVLDMPLCHNGVGQVARIADEIASLPITVVYAAPDQASQQTADAIAATKSGKIKTLDKLHNLNLGLWQGKLIEDVRQTQKKVYKQWQERPETLCPPEGESLGDASTRLSPILKKMVKRHGDEMIALVLPEPICSLVRALLTDENVGDLWAADGMCGSWELIDTRIPA